MNFIAGVRVENVIVLLNSVDKPTFRKGNYEYIPTIVTNVYTKFASNWDDIEVEFLRDNNCIVFEIGFQ